MISTIDVDFLCTPEATINASHGFLRDWLSSVGVRRGELPEKLGGAVRADLIKPLPQPPAVPTGLPSLDLSLNGGLGAGRYYLLLGDTGVGKTRTTAAWALNALRAGHRVVHIQTELTRDAVAALFREGGATEENLKSLWISATDDPREFESIFQELKPVQGVTPTLIVVDFAQLLRAKTAKERRDLEIQEIIRDLTRKTRDLGAALLLTSQVSRGAANAGLNVHSAADGASLERLADAVLSVKKVDGGLSFKVLKQRWGMVPHQEIRATVDWSRLIINENAGAAATSAGCATNARQCDHEQAQERVLNALREPLVPPEGLSTKQLADYAKVSEKIVRLILLRLVSKAVERLPGAGRIGDRWRVLNTPEGP